jgi:hypothetical protein
MQEITVDIVYWEGGNSYRPFIVLPASKKWLSKNMAYYKSSGESNTESKYRTNTWFPTLGLLKSGTVLYDELHQIDAKIYTDGYILKRSVLASIFDKPMSNWYRAINTKFEFVPKYESYGMISQFLMDHSVDMESVPKTLENIKDAALTLSDYCQFWWQVQSSAQCGGGLWDLLPEFCQFVLLHDYDDYTVKSNYEFVVQSNPLSVFHIVNRKQKKHDATEVNQYLMDNRALISDFLLEDYRENKAALKKYIYLGIPSSKRRTVNTVSKKRKRESSQGSNSRKRTKIGETKRKSKRV